MSFTTPAAPPPPNLVCDCPSQSNLAPLLLPLPHPRIPAAPVVYVRAHLTRTGCPLQGSGGSPTDFGEFAGTQSRSVMQLRGIVLLTRGVDEIKMGGAEARIRYTEWALRTESYPLVLYTCIVSPTTIVLYLSHTCSHSISSFPAHSL
ncbi:hypothetical protein C8J57DRAFT_1492483 [Mycena rebaudengoi]|nr:hypothetical protein C8J57DRAFT_1492483 [Mycena rebaudengoi]